MIPVSRPIISKEEIDSVMAVLKGGMIAQGPVVKMLEENTAKYCNAKYAVATNSGTAALHASLYAAGIRPGDEVITTPFTFVATSNSIVMQGAKPVFADIEPETFNIDPESIKAKITKKTKAIIPVDLYGQAYDVEAINEIAEKYNLKIIEDACQAIGASRNGKMAGTFGHFGAFSFYATKNITTAEGGMVLTDDEQGAELVKRFRHHGQSEQTRYQYFDLGYNYRMTDVHAAIGTAQLQKLPEWIGSRTKNAHFLDKRLGNIKGIITPITKQGNIHAYHQYTIRVKGFKLSRDEIISKLKEKGIGSGVYYPKPLHMHPFYEKMGYREGMFPVSEQMSKEVISLPVRPDLSHDELEQVARAFESL